MAYIKTNWKDYPDTSTPITAEALQNIEDGIEALDTDKAPKANPYKFNASRTSSQTGIADATYTKVVFNIKAFDTNNNYNVSDGLYTVPVSGYYQLDTMLKCAGAGGSGFAIKIVGSTSGTIANPYLVVSSAEYAMSSSICAYLTASETIQVQVYIKVSSGTAAVYGGSYFSAHLISI